MKKIVRFFGLSLLLANVGGLFGMEKEPEQEKGIVCHLDDFSKRFRENPQPCLPTEGHTARQVAQACGVDDLGIVVYYGEELELDQPFLTQIRRINAEKRGINMPEVCILALSKQSLQEVQCRIDEAIKSKSLVWDMENGKWGPSKEWISRNEKSISRN